MTTPSLPVNPSSGLDADGILRAANTVVQIRLGEQARLAKIAKYMRGKMDPPYTPKGASTEYRWLTARCHDNFLPLIVSVISQNLHVDGYRPTGYSDTETDVSMNDEPSWAAFKANRMTSRQHAIHRSVTKYGAAYVTVLPGRIVTADLSNPGAVTDKSMPVITAYSPRRMTALYADDISDEWPIFAMEEKVINDNTQPGKARRVVNILDDTNRYTLVGGVGSSPEKLTWPSMDDPILGGKPSVMSHGMGICPVVRFVYEADLDSDTDCVGEVEPLMSLQDQVNFHTFNILLAEQFAAFRQRWVSGMAPVDEAGRGARRFEPGVDRVWTAEDTDTRFGEFDVTPLQPQIDAREASIRHMSTISQVPPYHLLGALVNLSADALSAARDGLDRKVSELQSVLTDSWRNVFRLSAKASGDNEGWLDLFGTVVWRDTSARSFAASIDGLGKAAQMLGVPAEELWRRIPGVTADDVEAWKDAAGSKDAMAQLDKIVEAALTGGAMTSNPTPEQPFQLGSVGATAISPPPKAGAPLGSPANAVPDVGATGEPPGPASAGTTVEVPAHTRSMPDRPKPGPPPGRPKPKP